MSNSHFYQKNKSMMPQNNPNPINIVTNDNRNIMFVPQKPTQPVYLVGSQPANLLGNRLIPVIPTGSDKNLTATEKNLQIIDEVKRELEKNQAENSTNVQDIYSKNKNGIKCDLHPKQLSDKCRKCKEIKNNLLKMLEEQEKDKKEKGSSDYHRDQDKNSKTEKEKSRNLENALISQQNELSPEEVDPIFKVYGDAISGNLNPLIFNNILSCQYFKDDVAFKGFDDILAEILQNVTYAEPWAIGISGVPSTLFCCLYKLMLIKLTESQVTCMLTSRESPYIRCAGLLYIRYLSDPKELWSRLSKFIFDEEKFSPTANVKIKISIGDYVENLLKDYDYYGTRLPKIPTQIEREIKAKLLSVQEKRERKRKNEEKFNLFVPNSSCSAISFQDNNWHEGVIISMLNNNKQVYVKFINGSDELMYFVDSYKTENKRENFEIIKATYYQLAENYKRENLSVPFFNSEEIVDLGDVVINEKHNIHIEEKRDLKEDKNLREKSQDRRKSFSPYSRSRSHSKSHSRRRKKDKKKRKHRTRSSSSSSLSRSKHHRHQRERDRKKSHHIRSKHSRSRSRSRSKSTSSDYYKKKEKRRAEEKSKEDEKKIIEKILEKEKEAALAIGKDYAIKPTSYKSALFVKLPGQSRKRSKSPSPLKQNIKTIEIKKETKEEDYKQKKEYSKEFLERQENLRKQYGQPLNMSNVYSQKSKSNKDDLGPEIMKLG